MIVRFPRRSFALAASVPTLAITASACLNFPSGACDDFERVGRSGFDEVSCTADGKLSATRATGCHDPSGIEYETTVSECGPGTRCTSAGGATGYALGAACLQTCHDDTDCSLADGMLCEGTVCVKGVQAGYSCDGRRRCAGSRSCLTTTDAEADAPDADASAGDGGTASTGPAPCPGDYSVGCSCQ